jgi:hypothetical protein
VALLHQGQELLIDLNDVLEEQKDKESRNQDIDHIEGLSESETSKSEIQEIHEGLVATIGQLYQMSMLIRKPSYHDRLIGMKKLDSEPFQFWAKSHTAEKYPNADSLVIDRISSAMARQRAVLKYRERHHEKLSQGINPEDDGKSTILSETVVTDVFNEIPSQINDLISEAGVSETSYGGSLLDGSGSGAPRIPKLPKGAEEGPFECPYCFYIITVRDKRAWARHIFRDLMPYVCIFSGCETPNKLYESRRQWNHHIQQAHNATIAQGESYDCLICRNGSLPISNFQRHVGRHLEELALFLLPRTGEDDDEDEATDEKNEDDRAVRSTSEIYLDENLAEHITEDLDVIDKPTVLYKPVHVDEHSSVEPHNRSEDRPHSAEEYSNNSLSLTDQEKIDDRMHRLDNHERKSKMEKSEEGKGDPSRSDEMNTPKAMFSHMQWHEWEELEKIQAQYKAKIITKEGLERGTSGVEDDDEKREKELFSKAAAVEEWKQQRDQDIEYKLRYDFGYVEEEVEQILRKSKGGKETQEEDTRKEKGIEREKENEQLSEGRVTWIKVCQAWIFDCTYCTCIDFSRSIVNTSFLKL